MESPIKKSLFKAFRNPSLALLLIKARLHGLIGSKEFSGANENRSESDNGRYVSFVNKANNNFKAFKTFKRNPSYVEILEHASKEDGLSYLKIIADQTPELLNKINDFKINDLVGKTFSTTSILLVNHAISHRHGRSITSTLGDLQKLAAARRGRVLAEVTSAIALSTDQEQRLTTALTAIYKQEVQVQVVIDKKVIGGVAVRVGDEVIDGTVANRLAQVRRQLAG
jgi:ATP synthase F1 delta subunit